jgi:hypothetical protein
MGMVATQKERKSVSLEEKFSILWDTDKHIRTCILLVKQLGLSVSTLNTIVITIMSSKKMQIIVEDRLFFEELNTLLVFNK